MTAKDRREFNFDITEVDWEEYMEKYIVGKFEKMKRLDETQIIK
jgi:hypothetical protein